MLGWGEGGVGKKGGGRHVRVERGSSAVYTCLESGMVRALQGCSLLLALSHLMALASKLLLQIYELFLGSMQVNVPLGKLPLQLVKLVLGFLQITSCTTHSAEITAHVKHYFGECFHDLLEYTQGLAGRNVDISCRPHPLKVLVGCQASCQLPFGSCQLSILLGQLGGFHLTLLHVAFKSHRHVIWLARLSPHPVLESR